jgi:hypothetical protein
MGWWPTGNFKGDAIGDQPADAIGDAFESIASERGQRGAALPTVEQWMDALAAALAAEPERWLSDPERLVTHTLAFTRGAPAAVETVAAPANAEPDLVDRLSRALSSMVASYERAFDRRPRLVEVADALGFVACGDTADPYLAKPAGPITSIEAIPRETRRPGGGSIDGSP